jgi:hypothetical protein
MPKTSKRSATVINNQRCAGVKEDGSRCKVRDQISVINGMCIWHDPNRRAAAVKLRRKGGKAGGAATAKRLKAPPPPQSIEDAVQTLSWVTHAVSVGNLDPRRGQVIERACSAFIRGIKDRDMSKRMAMLEKRLKRLKATG